MGQALCVLVSWRLMQVLREACWARGRVRARARECAPERSRQAVSKAGESEGRAHLHALCAMPAASVQDGRRVHGAMATLERAREAMKRAYNVLVSWLLVQRAREGVRESEGACE